MCKRFLILLFAAVYCLDVAAQSVTVGFSMGANFSYLIGRDRVEDSKPRIGVCPAIHLNIPLVYESYLEISAIYSQQGIRIQKDDAKYRVTERIEGLPDPALYLDTYHYKYTEKREIDYLIIPVMWKQKFGDFYTQAGPFVGIPISARNTYKEDYIPTYNPIFNDTTKYTTHFEGEKKTFVNKLRQYDAGAMFAVGFQTSIGNKLDVFVSAGCRFGFFSVEEKEKNMSRSVILRNQVFSLTGGFFLVNNRMSKTYRRHRR